MKQYEQERFDRELEIATKRVKHSLNKRLAIEVIALFILGLIAATLVFSYSSCGGFLCLCST